MNIIDYIKSTANKLKFAKWFEIIQSETNAVNNSSFYLLEEDADNFSVVVVDDSGKKRKCIGVPKPNTTGTYILKSINGEIQWVTE